METLHWQIEGEFITDLVRQWFWQENKSYADCENLLFECMRNLEFDVKKKNALDIIEGRKKFSGINSFELVDDNKSIRYVTDKVNELWKQEEIRKIEDHIRGYAIDFIDPWSTIKSKKAAIENHVNTLEECEIWFHYSDRDQRAVARGEERQKFPMAYSYTAAGLWLTDRPELIFEAKKMGGDFWENIYQLTKDNPNLKVRNDRYITDKRIKEENKKSRERLWKEYEKEAQKQFENEPKFMSDEWFEYKYNTEDDKFSYYLEPDNYENWEGVIDPDGNFYSCHFGGHNLKSFYLILKYPNKFGIKASGSMLDLEFEIDQKLDVDAGNGLDFIVKHGWCATRHIGGRYFIELPTNNHLTQKQINAIFDASIKHDININEIENFEY